MYYNTTGEKGEQLGLFSDKAKSQDERIKLWFQNQPRVNYSPSQVWRLLFKDNIPLTSVRRSMTNLTREGVLCQTEEKRIGVYGRPEKTWRLC